jgi:hypothetical protein
MAVENVFRPMHLKQVGFGMVNGSPLSKETGKGEALNE